MESAAHLISQLNNKSNEDEVVARLNSLFFPQNPIKKENLKKQLLQHFIITKNDELKTLMIDMFCVESSSIGLCDLFDMYENLNECKETIISVMTKHQQFNPRLFKQELKKLTQVWTSNSHIISSRSWREPKEDVSEVARTTVRKEILMYWLVTQNETYNNQDLWKFFRKVRCGELCSLWCRQYYDYINSLEGEPQGIFTIFPNFVSELSKHLYPNDMLHLGACCKYFRKQVCSEAMQHYWCSWLDVLYPGVTYNKPRVWKLIYSLSKYLARYEKTPWGTKWKEKPTLHIDFEKIEDGILCYRHTHGRGNEFGWSLALDTQKYTFELVYDVTDKCIRITWKGHWQKGTVANGIFMISRTKEYASSKIINCHSHKTWYVWFMKDDNNIVQAYIQGCKRYRNEPPCRWPLAVNTDVEPYLITQRKT